MQYKTISAYFINYLDFHCKTVPIIKEKCKMVLNKV
jgi:hypothetical protein